MSMARAASGWPSWPTRFGAPSLRSRRSRRPRKARQTRCSSPGWRVSASRPAAISSGSPQTPAGLGREARVPVSELLAACSVLGAQAAEVPQDWAIVGDATRLRQALANVVANGLRHGTEVAVTARAEAEEIVIEITDNGPGVSPELDVFARGVSGAGSSGYGLWLAREIARSHGGTLELVPAGPPGATFRFVLPSASAS